MNRPSGKDTPSSTTAAGSGDKSSRSIELVENRIDSRQLFAAAREITIAHGDELYRLRITSQNKLILTK